MRISAFVGVILVASVVFADAKTFDVVIYGGTSTGVAAAVQARRMGRSVILVSPDKHLGGLSRGRLDWTDSGRKEVGVASDPTGERPYAKPQEGLSIGGCSLLGLPSEVSPAAPDDPFHRPPIRQNPPAPTENTQPPKSFHASLPKAHDLLAELPRLV